MSKKKSRKYSNAEALDEAQRLIERARHIEYTEAVHSLKMNFIRYGSKIAIFFAIAAMMYAATVYIKNSTWEFV